MIIHGRDAADALERHRRDLDVACPVVHCRARRGEPCRGTPAGTVHQSRRVVRLQRERGALRPR